MQSINDVVTEIKARKMDIYTKDWLNGISLSIVDTNSSHHLHFHTDYWKRGQIDKFLEALDQRIHVSIDISPRLRLVSCPWKDGDWSLWVMIDYCAYTGRLTLTEKLKTALMDVDKRMANKHESESHA